MHTDQTCRNNSTELKNVIGDKSAPQWTARTVPVSSLVPFEKNPRRITPAQFDALKRSIAQDGYHQRILVTRDLRVIVRRWQDFTGQQARLESTGAPFSDKVAA